MKNLTKLWSLALLLTAAMFMVSCDEDEPVIDVDEDGLSVADGYYFVVEGEEPVAERALLPEKVEGEGNAPTDREGFFGNYVYLKAGDYQIQKVESREVTATLGGAISKVEVADLVNAGEEPFDGYQLGMLEDEGPNVSIANDGFFKISYDETTTELIVMEVKKVSFIGAPSGWSDVEMDVISSNPEEGFIFEANGIEINQNDNYKLRINNAWKIIRNNEEGNGYVAFTNYGGSADALVAGGGDIPFAQESGVYTVKVELQNDGGAFVEFDKTGDAAAFAPEDYQWAITGAATPNGWANDDETDDPIGVDIDFNYEGESNGTYTWLIESIDLTADQFKFRANDAWSDVLGFSSVTLDGPDANLIVAAGADDNFENTQYGEYKITLTTSDDGVSYTVSFELLQAYDDGGSDPFDPSNYQWAVVGAATELGWPEGACGDEGEDVDMTYDGESDGTHTWSVELPLTANEFKFRPNDCWDDGELNFSNTTLEGSAAGNFSNPENGNISCDVAATYSIVLTTSDEGESYVANIAVVE
jgi:hypothetical protein